MPARARPGLRSRRAAAGHFSKPGCCWLLQGCPAVWRRRRSAPGTISPVSAIPTSAIEAGSGTACTQVPVPTEMQSEFKSTCSDCKLRPTNFRSEAASGPNCSHVTPSARAWKPYVTNRKSSDCELARSSPPKRDDNCTSTLSALKPQRCSCWKSRQIAQETG